MSDGMSIGGKKGSLKERLLGSCRFASSINHQNRRDDHITMILITTMMIIVTMMSLITMVIVMVMRMVIMMIGK